MRSCDSRGENCGGSGTGQTGAVLDLTLAAIPGFFGTMELERRYLLRRDGDGPSQVTYTRPRHRASLTMGVLSLVVPLATVPLARRLAPQRSRLGKALVAVGVGAVAATTVADAWAQRPERRAWRRRARSRAHRRGRPRSPRWALAATAAWATATAHRAVLARGQRPRPRRRRRAGCAGDRRLGLHLLLEPPVHAREPVHVGDPRRAPLERALQPVDRAAPARRRRARHCSRRTALLCLARHPPGADRDWRAASTCSTSTGSTPTRSAGSGRLEKVLNTPSHHRVHHGSNQQYIDRNHGSILIVWDRLFGTFEPEDDAVVYGLTKNIDTFNPWRIAIHEYARHPPRRRAQRPPGATASRSWSAARAGRTDVTPSRRPGARSRPPPGTLGQMVRPGPRADVPRSMTDLSVWAHVVCAALPRSAPASSTRSPAVAR